MTFPILYQWSKHINLPSVIFIEKEFYNLILAILNHRLTTDIASRLSHPCKKQTEEVVDLSGGADCASRILIYSLLLYAYHRA